MPAVKKITVLFCCFIIVACATPEEELYHYTPVNKGEVPATFTNSMVFKDIVSGIYTKHVSAQVDKINNKEIEFKSSNIPPAERIEIYQLSPGHVTLHVVGGTFGLLGFLSLSGENIIFDAKPGEKYTTDQCGMVRGLGLCIVDSQDHIIARQLFDVF